jgi:peptidyl-prolyl cis-trans isomerase D
MLLNFRDNLSGAAKVILIAIIIVPFALFGVDALFVGDGAPKEAANVNGDAISELSLRQAVLVQKQQIIKNFQNVDPSLIDEERLKPAVMQRLIRQKVEEQAASKLGMAIPSETVFDLLSQVPEFQTNGKFDVQRYEFVVRQMGYTPSGHNKAIRSELLVNQFLQGVVATGFSTEKELALLASVTEQTRDYYYLTIPAAPLMNSLKPSEEDLEAYYDSHSQQFMTEEQLVVEYIELQPSDLVKDISVDSDLVEERYQSKVDAATSSASRHAAHILLEKQDDDSHLSNMAKIQDKLKNGDDFASLAGEYSEDFATSENGGDLGYTQPGDLPAELDSALDKLSVGEVSEIVETKAGVHIVKFLDERAVDIPSRDVLEPAIREELELEMAQNLMPERIEALKDLSYNATSLQGTADDMALDLKVSEPFGRSGGTGVASSTQVVEAAFSDAVLEEGYASEVIELSDDLVVVLSVRERVPARLKPLSEVRTQIELAVKGDMARKKILLQGDMLEQRVKSGSSIDEVAKAESLNWQVSLNTKRVGGLQNDPVRKQVFSMPVPSNKAVVDHLILPNGDYVLVSLVKVEVGDYRSLGLEQKQALSSSSSLAVAGREYGAYGSLLLEDADVASRY